MKIFLGLLAFFITGFNNKSFSCDCVTPTLEESLTKYNDIIFVGILHEKIDSTNLYSTSPYGAIKYYNFTVLKYYKGLTKENQQISILQEGSDCDFPYERISIGDTLLIYGNANRFGFGYFVEANACSRTEFVSRLHDEMELKFYKDNSLWKFPSKSVAQKMPAKQITEIDKKAIDNKINPFLPLIFSSLVNVILALLLFLKLKR